MSEALVNRRAHFRVATRIPVRHHAADPEDVERFEWELRSAPKVGEPIVDPVLASNLERLERKLDAIVAQLQGGEPPLGDHDMQDVDLSADGIRIPSEQGLSVGDPVMIECLIPDGSVREIRAVGRVVRSIEAESDAEAAVAVQFQSIAERDRAALLRFTQEVQRCAHRSEA